MLRRGHAIEDDNDDDDDDDDYDDDYDDDDDDVPSPPIGRRSW